MLQPNNPNPELLSQAPDECQGPCQEPTEGQSLGDFSPKHAKWKNRKAAAVKIAAMCAEADDEKIRKQGVAIAACMDIAHLQGVLSPKTGEQKRRLVFYDCHNKHCAVSQAVRCSKLNKRFKEALTEINEHEPDNAKSAFLMLTLTVRNCPVAELRKTLTDMGKAWQRLLKLKEFQIVKGWIRGTEVTRGAWIDTRTGQQIDKRKLEKVPVKYRRLKDPTLAHPHFHALLLVPPSYFSGKSYINHEKWVELWQKAARLNYTPSVDIRRVKTTEGGLNEAIKAATYSVKPEELQDDREWFYEFHRQVCSLRFLATGGTVKEVMRALEELKPDDPEWLVLWERLFNWTPSKWDFLHKPQATTGV